MDIPNNISHIAALIDHDWTKQGRGVSPYAQPYLDAMYEMEKVTDAYYLDSGPSIIRYFLANATSWKGETAREIKKHLNTIVKGIY